MLVLRIRGSARTTVTDPLFPDTTLFRSEIFGTVGEYTIALRIETRRHNGGGVRRFLYVPACAAPSPALQAELADADLLMFDGTLWQDDEMQRQGDGSKPGRRMGHMSLSGPDGTLAVFADSPVARKVRIPINNTNPTLLADSPASAEEHTSDLHSLLRHSH